LVADAVVEERGDQVAVGVERVVVKEKGLHVKKVEEEEAQSVDLVVEEELEEEAEEVVILGVADVEVSETKLFV
jgi:hypothetical protein